MGAKTKSVFPVVQITESDTSCECRRDTNYFQKRNFLKCKDNLCQSCLQRIAIPRTKSNQTLCNIPILCHIQSVNFDNKRSEFQKLLRAQRKNSFLDFLPSNFSGNQFRDDLLCARFSINSKIVTTGSTQQPIGSIPAPVKHQTESLHSRSGATIDSNSKCSPHETTINGKINDEIAKCRIKDEEGYIRRAACVCVNEDETKVLLVSSKNDGGGWLIPGGGLEDGEEEIVAATREAWEEAGIKGRITRWLGVFQYKDDATKKKKRTSVFVMKVTEELNDFPEANLGRVRGWFDFHEAKNLLSICKPNQMAYLDSLLD